MADKVHSLKFFRIDNSYTAEYRRIQHREKDLLIHPNRAEHCRCTALVTNGKQPGSGSVSGAQVARGTAGGLHGLQRPLRRPLARHVSSPAAGGSSPQVEKCKAAAELKGNARATSGGAAANGAGGGKSPAAAVAATAAASGGGTPGGRVAGYLVAYCGNLAFEAGVEELQKLFEGAGVVPSKIRLHTDKASGRWDGQAGQVGEVHARVWGCSPQVR
jgi:hypothetical protein